LVFVFFFIWKTTTYVKNGDGHFIAPCVFSLLVIFPLLVTT